MPAFHPLCQAPRFARQLLVAALCGVATPLALAAAVSVEDARSKCVAELDEERCNDTAFLQQEYGASVTPDAQEIARRAGVRKNRNEQRALREVLFRHTGLCDQKPSQYCPPGNYAACAEQLRQTCDSIRLQMAMCDTQIKTYCRQHGSGGKCMEQMKNQCDSSRQTLDQILAKYPDLSPTQKSKLKQIATELEKNTDKSALGALTSTFLQLLGFAI